MENKILTYALVKLFDKLYTLWYVDSSCDGECFNHRYTHITDKYTIVYDPTKGFVNNDFVNNKILITIKINDGEEEINQENLSISLNKIEEAINKDLFLIRKYFNPHATYTYKTFGTDWKTNFTIVDNQTLTIFIKPYWFEEVETMGYSSYHLLLIGSHKEDIDKDEYDYEYLCEKKENDNLSYEQKIRKKFLHSLCLDNINLYEPITVYTGEYFHNDEEIESKFPKEIINIDEIFEKELSYYEFEQNVVDVNYIKHTSKRVSLKRFNDDSNEDSSDDSNDDSSDDSDEDD